VVVTALAPALVVPDEQTWTVLGTDPATLGLEPAFAVGKVERVLLPSSVPLPLAEPLSAYLALVPEGVDVEERPLALPTGEPEPLHIGHHEHDSAAHDDDGSHDAHPEHRAHKGHHDRDQHAAHGREGEHAGHPGHGAHGGHGGHGEHAGHGEHHDHGGAHDHHAMMAIVGEPSADGLVMESIDLRYGPLGTPLPGGLAVDVKLDGDVVAEASVRALLHSFTDPLAPEATKAPAGWEGVAAVETERAVSHLAWLRAFARLLGWPRLVDACRRAIAASDDPVAAGTAVDAVVALVDGSRWLRVRTAGRGNVGADEARATGLHGPNARASGLADDARTHDPRYRALGFEPVIRIEGDALARTIVRAHEARAALRLAAAALDADDEPPAGAAVEGPRGGAADAMRDVAGQAMVGAEWAAALVTLASFDLSPWDVVP
jgi:Respiratory-chain NADH dehydrogenase, 49 Kd subunit